MENKDGSFHLSTRIGAFQNLALARSKVLCTVSVCTLLKPQREERTKRKNGLTVMGANAEGILPYSKIRLSLLHCNRQNKPQSYAQCDIIVCVAATHLEETLNGIH